MTFACYGIHWFRRDLRVAGNPALQANLKRHRGRVLGLFAFDKAFLARPDFSHNRFGFFLKTLAALRDEIRTVGGDLLVLDTGPRAAYEQLFTALKRHHIPLPATVSFNRDYEPFARQRDANIADWLPKQFGVEVHSDRDHLLIEPDELTRNDEPGAMYQVYSPFAKRWFAQLQTDEVRDRIVAQKSGLAYLDHQGRPKKLFEVTWAGLFGDVTPPQDHLDDYLATNAKHLTVELPDAGSRAALAQLRSFRKSGLAKYAHRRDFPGINGTSHLSIYLKNGSITSAMILAELGILDADFSEKDSRTTFLKELVWREFYYHVLYHRPEVEKTAFLKKYRDLEWENNERFFEAWQQGETGYPIVDAGMRQLRDTGWMHNRVRMIVASFLTKDLLIDWRWGERHFMEQLLDGDLAPNNGGWQWAASTGCDPQPYFRIFNPRLQSEKFDPEGDYIRTWVPELRDVPTEAIHDPHAAGLEVRYPRPIVDHKVQKELALSLYKSMPQ